MHHLGTLVVGWFDSGNNFITSSSATKHAGTGTFPFATPNNADHALVDWEFRTGGFHQEPRNCT